MITNYEERIKVIDGVIEVAKRHGDYKSLAGLAVRKQEEIQAREAETEVA